MGEKLTCAIKGRSVSPDECSSIAVKANAEDFEKCKACPRGQALAKLAPSTRQALSSTEAMRTFLAARDAQARQNGLTGQEDTAGQEQAGQVQTSAEQAGQVQTSAEQAGQVQTSAAPAARPAPAPGSAGAASRARTHFECPARGFRVTPQECAALRKPPLGQGGAGCSQDNGASCASWQEQKARFAEASSRPGVHSKRGPCGWCERENMTLIKGMCAPCGKLRKDGDIELVDGVWRAARAPQAPAQAKTSQKAQDIAQAPPKGKEAAQAQDRQTWPPSAWDKVSAATGISSHAKLALAIGREQSSVSHVFRLLAKGKTPKGEIINEILQLSGLTLAELLGQPGTSLPASAAHAAAPPAASSSLPQPSGPDLPPAAGPDGTAQADPEAHTYHGPPVIVGATAAPHTTEAAQELLDSAESPSACGGFVNIDLGRVGEAPSEQTMLPGTMALGAVAGATIATILGGMIATEAEEQLAQASGPPVLMGADPAEQLLTKDEAERLMAKNIAVAIGEDPRKILADIKETSYAADGWEDYEPNSARILSPSASIGRGGDLSINTTAVKVFKLKDVGQVRLRWNAAKCQLGLLPCAPDSPHKIKIQAGRQSNCAVCTAGMLRVFGLNPVRGKAFPITSGPGGMLVVTIELLPAEGEEAA